MGKKKGKAKGKGKKKSGGKKTVKLSEDQLKRIAQADQKAVKARQEVAMSVRWVDPIRTWFQDNKAPAFDRLRMADKDGSGILSGDTLAECFRALKIPLKNDDLLTLVESLDFDGTDEIRYCTPPKSIRGYGGGLQEFIGRGLERVMYNHQQDLAEIEAEHSAALDAIKGVTASAGGALEEGAEGLSAENGEHEDADGDGGENSAGEVNTEVEPTTA